MTEIPTLERLHELVESLWYHQALLTDALVERGILSREEVVSEEFREIAREAAKRKYEIESTAPRTLEDTVLDLKRRVTHLEWIVASQRLASPELDE